MRYIWHLDDTDHWHTISANTIQQIDGWELRSFYTGQDLFNSLEKCINNDQQYPLIILMDFYLSGERGDQITSAIRKQTSSSPHITIIGFSSVRSCSERICQSGGDSILIKADTGSGLNKYLFDYVSEYPLR